MMKIVVLSTLALSSTTLAQQPGPKPRPLGPTVATAKETLGATVMLRALPDGRVLVNDPASRRVLLFDSTLAAPVAVADSTSATGNAYSGRIAGLVPYKADSTLFVDPQSMSMLVIDPTGKLGRVMSVPRTQDAFLLSGIVSAPAYDGAGRLVYRGNNMVMPQHRPTNGAFVMPPQPDTAPIVRVDLTTRVLDTVGFVKVPKISVQMATDSAGRMSVRTELNPLPLVDDWAVLADGSVAIVRGRDYHVEWVSPSGEKRTTAKLPFEWRRLSDEDKVAFIDSVKVARERMIAAGGGNGPFNGGGPVMMTFSGPPGGAATGAAQGQRTIVMGGDGPPPRGGAPAGGVTQMGPPQVTFVAPADLPDYQPPFFANALRADTQGNLWVRILPAKAIPGGPIYDVIDGKGELVERVQIPVGRVISGFGKDGSVYLTYREGQKTTLERARVP